MTNLPCPCGSGTKYKRCCKLLHDGAPASNALQLMKSRYSAYAVGDSRYIMSTTHPSCSEYDRDALRWALSIATFHRGTEFCGLRIDAFVDGAETASVIFHASLRQAHSDASFTEKSTFTKVDGRWLYRSGRRVQSEGKP